MTGCCAFNLSKHYPFKLSDFYWGNKPLKEDAEVQLNFNLKKIAVKVKISIFFIIVTIITAKKGFFLLFINKLKNSPQKC